MSLPDETLATYDSRVSTTLAELLSRVSTTQRVQARDCAGCGGALACVELVRQLRRAGDQRKVVYVVAEDETAHQARRDLEFLAQLRPAPRPALPEPDPLRVVALHPPDVSHLSGVRPDRVGVMRRLYSLYRLAEGSFEVLVLPVAALRHKYVPRRALRGSVCRLRAGEQRPLEELAGRLNDLGYARSTLVEDPGGFALRGGLLDVWPIQAPRPLRIEWDGDEVERIRSFDPDSQLTDPAASSLDAVELVAAREAPLGASDVERAKEVLRSLCDACNYPSSQTRLLVEEVTDAQLSFQAGAYLPAFYQLESLWDYWGHEPVFVIERPEACVAARERAVEADLNAHAALADRPHFSLDQFVLSSDELDSAIARSSCLALHTSIVSGEGRGQGLSAFEFARVETPSLGYADPVSIKQHFNREQRKSSTPSEGLEWLFAQVRSWQLSGWVTLIVTRSHTQAERLATLFGHHEIDVSVTDAPDRSRGAVLLTTAGLARGLVAESERLALITEDEIFERKQPTKAAAKRRTTQAFLETLRSLKPGDYVVHDEHGIGRYLGLECKRLGTDAKPMQVELLVIEYTGNDKLLVPVHRLSQIQRYAGGGADPKLDRLGGQSFSKTKRRARQKVREMADELLRLYAERASQHKLPLEPAGDDYVTFEAEFPFEETADQAAAIVDVNADLESSKIMDRLVCGDVGFGKTEVALRAALRHALAGNQVALLCPTTILAQQHYLTFTRRFAGYPLQVRSLSRFDSKHSQQETIVGIREGRVDVAIGTHRLLSKDVHFKRLGLVVIDEEQRFGVVHKERLKKLRLSVDVLTLTATPIPRTLQLAVGGLRDMSVITTPPADRRAIRTVTARYDDALLKEVIEHEVQRGGQVFYVYNRVQGIYERAAALQALLPKVRVAVGHGQMRESTLEKTMLAFVRGEFDVLVATTIVESGLDIPRANTMIIEHADKFGLAQLYQLRGRVGRASERAYCYLLVPPPSQLSEEARTRIEAIERYSDLGSGFQIASLDMELRGAGDFLGADQSGTLQSVGFELFCELLQEATAELRGEVLVHEVDPDLSFDVEALLPSDYLPDIGLRLSMYKKLSSAADPQEVLELGRELEDRFGRPPPEAARLLRLMALKTELRKLRALSCEANANQVVLHLRSDTPLQAAKVTALLAKAPHYRLTPEMRLSRRRMETEPKTDGLGLAEKVLHELAPLCGD